MATVARGKNSQKNQTNIIYNVITDGNLKQQAYPKHFFPINVRSLNKK